LRALHREKNGRNPFLFRAPGRVSVIGAHTDYAEGFCIPAALDLSTLVAASPSSDGQIRIHTVELQQEAVLPLQALGDKGYGHWSDYIAGVARELQRAGVDLHGATLTISGDVPIGAGLSSSASLEVAAAAALLRVAGAEMPGLEIARLARRAENDYVGAPCGIMDQFIAVHGVAGNALVLDCRTLTAEPAPIPDTVRLVILNSMVKHSIAGGEYGVRRAQVAEATRMMTALDPAVRALRDVSLGALNAAQEQMDCVVFRRARHIVTENQRVLDLAAALRSGDLRQAGKIMVASHASYRDDFDGSCEECDLLVELAVALPSCYGSCLTGGGFGGCTVSLVDAEQSAAFAGALREQYRSRTGIEPQYFIPKVADGLHEVSL